MAKASDNLFPKVLVTEGSAPASPAAGGQALFIDSADHKLKRKNSSGTVTIVEGSGGSGQGLVDFARAKRTAGNVAINSTTFINVDTGLDLVMSASIGDVIECELFARAFATSGSTYVVFDFHTIVSASPVNSITSETTAGTSLSNSFPGFGRGIVGTDAAGGAYFAGKKRYTLVSGDISSGTVTLRLRVFSGASATVNAADPMLYVAATNLGQQL